MIKLKNILRNKKYLLLLFIVTITLEGIFCYYYFTKRDTLHCESSFSFGAPQHNFELKGIMALKLDSMGEGEIFLDGGVKSKGIHTRLHRYILFKYHKYNETTFRMNEIKVEKGVRDKAPDADISENFFSLDLEARRILVIRQLGEGYLVGGLEAPAFMCIPQ